MTLKQRIDDELKKAMKARDESALTAVRMLKAALTNREIELGKELDDAEVLRLIEKQLKQRKESADQFRKGGREDLANKEEKEAALLQTFMPQRLTAEEMERLVAEVIAQTGATSIKQMGQVMKAAQARAQGRVEGQALSEVVKKQLAQKA